MNRTAFVCLLASTLTLALMPVPQASAATGSWHVASGGAVPDGSFVGGTTRANTPIYICRVTGDNFKIVGRMITPKGAPGPGCVYVKEGEIIVDAEEYEVLEEHPSYTWQDWADEVPEKAIVSGSGVGQSNNTHYICQASSPEDPNALIPGKFRDRDKICLIVYGKSPGLQRTVHETTSGFKLLVKE
ncbi:MAG: DM9 repeat-containing protein [Acidobacteriota bacterium]